MMKTYHPACKECVLNGDCLLQDNGDTDECEDVREWELEHED